MEIEFNPSRIPTSKPGYNEPVARRDTAAAGLPAKQNPALGELEAKLNRLSEVRPEKVAQAKALLSNELYPPEYLLDRIAVLLAVQIKD